MTKEKLMEIFTSLSSEYRSVGFYIRPDFDLDEFLSEISYEEGEDTDVDVIIRGRKYFNLPLFV